MEHLINHMLVVNIKMYVRLFYFSSIKKNCLIKFRVNVVQMEHIVVHQEQLVMINMDVWVPKQFSLFIDLTIKNEMLD
jgi:hypothetical protein